MTVRRHLNPSAEASPCSPIPLVNPQALRQVKGSLSFLRSTKAGNICAGVCNHPLISCLCGRALLTLTAFHPETNGTVDIYVDGDYVLTFEAEEGTSEFQEITGLAGYTGAEIDITGANSEGDWLAILEVGCMCAENSHRLASDRQHFLSGPLRECNSCSGA